MTGTADFWARRKAFVAEEAEQAKQEQVLVEHQDAQAVLEEKSDTEILEKLELPDPDSLEQGDDFSVFLAKAVPERIRRRALRKLWLSNPVLANLDQLVDYGEDYTDKAMVIEGMQTAYQVGKGMLKHVEEMARQAALETEEESQEAIGEEAQDTPIAAAEPIDQPEAALTLHKNDEDSQGYEDEEVSSTLVTEDLLHFPRRRLRFEYVGVDDQTLTETI